MKKLHLILKRKWFEMIASGEKTEEYRDCSPYWTKRLEKFKHAETLPGLFHVVFRLGYYSNAPRMTFEIDSITVGKGREEWGAEPGKEYYIIKLGKRL